MSNKNKTTLYIGVTSDLLTRILQHKNGEYRRSFTDQYNVHSLVYYENYPSIEEAIEREKQIKKYSRIKKEILINKMNPNWIDLFDTLEE